MALSITIMDIYAKRLENRQQHTTFHKELKSRNDNYTFLGHVDKRTTDE